MEKLQQLSLRIHEIFGMCLEGLGGSQSSQPTQAKGPLDKQGPILGQLGNAPPVSLGALPQALTWCRDPKSTSALQWGHPKIAQWLAVRGLGTLPGSRGQS